jgi:hypothetical protein
LLVTGARMRGAPVTVETAGAGRRDLGSMEVELSAKAALGRNFALSLHRHCSFISNFV